MATIDQQFEAIARRHLGVETLEERRRDSLDFHEVGVCSIKAALSAAYEAGRDAAGGSDLAAVLREHFTPHAVALIAAKQQPGYAKGPEAEAAERASRWLAERIVEMLGTDQYHAICDELGL